MKSHAALGQALALLIWSKNDSGEADVAIYPGVLAEVAGTPVLRRSCGGGDVPLQGQWLERIALVPPGMRDTLKRCDYQLSLSAGEIQEPTPERVALGLNWPR